MWFIFISAIGSLPRLLHPSRLAVWTGSRLFRREPPNSTDGTFTHEHRTLRGLLPGCLFIEPCGPKYPLFIFLRLLQRAHSTK
jgi:hypothetical protein